MLKQKRLHIHVHSHDTCCFDNYLCLYYLHLLQKRPKVRTISLTDKVKVKSVLGSIGPPTQPELHPAAMWHEATRSTTTPHALDGILVHRKVTPSISSSFLPQDPFILLGRERHGESKVSHPKYNKATRPGLEPRPLDPGPVH